MSTSRRLLSSAAVLITSSALCLAQNIAPAHSGTVHYFDGEVTVDNLQLVSQTARFTELKEQGVLHTGLGRAEILLTPGVYLRIAENSSIKMLDNRLMSTRIELISGTGMVESDDPGLGVKDPAVTIIYKGFEAQPLKFGIFEISSQPGQVRVFKGEAKVGGNGASVTVKNGNLVNLSTTMAVARFDATAGDDLYVWSRDRSAYLAAGNMSSARTIAAGSTAGYGGGWSPYLYNGFSGGWYYNSLLGMYSFIPFGGTVYGPFGYGLYNPITLYYSYFPTGYNWSGAGGPRTGATASVPLSQLTSVRGNSTATVTQLPRLSLTSHPTLYTPAPGTQPAMASAPLQALNNNGFNAAASQSSSAGLVSSPVSMSVSAPVSAPAMSAPAASAPAAAPVSVRR